MADAPGTSAPRQTREVAEATLRRLQAEINEGRLEVYQNVFEQGYINFRAEGRPQGTHCLQSEFVRGWLANFAWDNNIGLLREHETDRILLCFPDRPSRTTAHKLKMRHSWRFYDPCRSWSSFTSSCSHRRSQPWNCKRSRCTRR